MLPTVTENISFAYSCQEGITLKGPTTITWKVKSKKGKHSP
jgi:hypothetical protein